MTAPSAKNRMQILIPMTYALADAWYNLSFFVDIVFDTLRLHTLPVVMMTYLLTRPHETTPFAEEEANEQVARSAEDLEDESDSGIPMCAQRRRRIARLTAGVQWQHHGRRRIRSRRH